MNHIKLSTVSRILVAFASGALLCAFFIPVWRIDLFAPQYPEGLTMNIWINGLSGDVEIINGLNHYIGMQHITEDMFPEFTYLSYVVSFFILLGITVAITGSHRLLFLYLLLSAIGAVLAIYDFYSWGYDYGHNLDPRAPIQVPGLSYQPPVFGHKRLLNFDAWSLPHVGGWVIISAGILAFTVWLAEWWKARRTSGTKTSVIVTSLFLIFFISSCQSGPSAMEPGKDACHFCKMGVSDTKFGASLLTSKGKEFKFDDLQCLIRFTHGKDSSPADIKSIWTLNYLVPGEYIPVEKAVFSIDPSFKSPMGSHCAGFASSTEALSVSAGQSASIFTWIELQQKLNKE